MKSRPLEHRRVGDTFLPTPRDSPEEWAFPLDFPGRK